MGAIKAARMQITGTYKPGDTFGRRVVTSPFDGLIATLKPALGIFDITKTPSWMCAEDLAWPDHRIIFPRI